jgi:hypothetical protein
MKANKGCETICKMTWFIKMCIKIKNKIQTQNITSFNANGDDHKINSSNAPPEIDNTSILA